MINQTPIKVILKHNNIRKYLKLYLSEFKRFEGAEKEITAPDCSGNPFLFFLLK